MRRSWTLFASLILIVATAPGAFGQIPDSTLKPDTTAKPDSTLASAPTVTLTLMEALTQARSNSPLYRQALNNAGPAGWAVRNAYGQLLPGFSVSAGMDYTGSGQANFGQGFTRATSATIGSNYQAGFLWQVDGSRILGPGQQRANRRATDEEIESEGNNLRFAITDQYLLAAAGAAQVTVSARQVERNQRFLELAQARYRVGQGTLIEVRQAEVQKGTADVQLLRDQQAENEAKLELFRQMGVVPPVSVTEIALTDSFPVTEPTFQLADLLELAKDKNPALRALRARQNAASTAVTSAKTAYLPSLSLQAGWSAFTQEQTSQSLLVNQVTAGSISSAAECITNDSLRVGAGLAPLSTPAGCFQANGLNATGTALTPGARSSLIDQNNVFPFDFTKQPFFASLTISLPIFTGFGRSLRVSQAKELEQDADENVRAQALRLQTDVNGRYLALNTAYQAIGVQAQSREAARDQLRLAEDRYRLGSGSSLEVTDAQNAVQRAEGDYIAAVYAYHRAVASLEAAVGRPLR